MIKKDTITAIATPPGRGSLGIIRISGPLTTLVAKTLLNKIPKPRKAEYLPFKDINGAILDYGIAIFFPNPNSFTGEDVLELQGHGSSIVLDLILQHILLIKGIRIANPGEFSKRAFLNNKLDLIQVEAIADLIEASSIQAARSAIKSLQGIFSKNINEITDSLINLRIYIEASLNFPNEEIESLSKTNIGKNLDDIIIKIKKLLLETHQGNMLREGIKVIIVGKPNAGKSSLFNKLVGYDAAIVTSIAGTTRDVLREHIYIDNIPINIIDTAGIQNTFNEIEKIGIKCTWREIKQADHILLITDGTDSPIEDPDKLYQSFISRIPIGIPITIIRNKADLIGEKIEIKKINNYTVITLSAQYENGIDLLRNHIRQNIIKSSSCCQNEGIFLARRRHLIALNNASIHLLKGKEYLKQNFNEELLAEELKLAQLALDEITGKFSSDNLLDKIFSNFCIGK